MEGSLSLQRINIQHVSRNAKDILDRRKSVGQIVMVCTPECNLLSLKKRAVVEEECPVNLG